MTNPTFDIPVFPVVKCGGCDEELVISGIGVGYPDRPISQVATKVILTVKPCLKCWKAAYEDGKSDGTFEELNK